jgi:serine/threonine-protein kinase
MGHEPGTHGPREGDIIDDKFLVEKTLHVGPHTMVVAARHLVLDERFVLKFLLPEGRSCPDALPRFVREARAAARIRSDRIARVFDMAVKRKGPPYIVMEHLEGEDLAQWLRRHGRLPYTQAVDLVLHACEAVAEMHALGMVHRDLKPTNLFVVHRGGAVEGVKVLDLGIVKEAPGSRPESLWDGARTQDGTVVGSPLYMSPEQMESASEVGVGTDIWSLGVILFELISGKVPHEGRSLVQIYSKITSAARAPRLFPATLCPAGLEAVISRCLSVRPEDRYRDVTELVAALAAFGSTWSTPVVERILGRAGGAAAPRETPVSGPRRLATEAGAPDADRPDTTAQDSTLLSFGVTRSRPEDRAGRVALAPAAVDAKAAC